MDELRNHLPDEADKHLIELAVAGAAQFVATRDLRDFKRAELSFAGLGFFALASFLKELTP